MPAGTLDEDVLALNLSFVLREPSTSRTVQRAVRECRRFARNRQNLLRSFRQIATDELQTPVTIAPTIQSVLERQSGFQSVLTANVGLPELLPGLLAHFQSSTSPPNVRIFERGSMSTTNTLTLFGHPTRLEKPPSSVQLVCALVLMPDQKSLLLTGSPVGSPSQTLENVIRDFVDQWTPQRALWDHPMETIDPSILQAAWKADDR